MTPPLFVPALGRSLYPGASVALDFTRNLYRSGTPVVKGSPSLLSGWTFTRASTGYAETAAGALVAFASGAPRITDKGLLVEESRTNLCLQSEAFGTTWSPNDSSVTSNVTTAPDGTSTADKLTENTANTTHYIAQSFTKAASAIAYSMSVFVKAAGRTKIRLTAYNGPFSVSANAIFDLSAVTAAAPTGGFTAMTSSITAMADGWYRCVLNFTSDTDTTVRFFPFLLDASGNAVYTGDGASGVYLWGAQLEAGAFPTSYIPTTTASATRAEDFAFIATTSLAYPVTSVVAFARSGGAGADVILLQLDDGTSNERYRMRIAAADDTFNTSVIDGGAELAVATVAGALAVGTTYKAASRVALNSVQSARGGTLGTEDTAVTMPASPTNIRIGTNSTPSAFAQAYIRQIIIYPTAFTDAALQGATA